MEQPKRARGRPNGPGIDDTESLAAVAEKLATDSSMPPMKAMGLVADELGLRPSRDSAIRRLKRKWDKEGTGLLAAARQRIAAEQMRRAAEVTAEYLKRWQEKMNSPEVIEFVRVMDKYAKFAREFAMSPKMAEFVRQMDDHSRKIQEVAVILGRDPVWSRPGVISIPKLY